MKAAKKIVVRVLRRDFEKALKMVETKRFGHHQVCPIAQAVRRVTGTHKAVSVDGDVFIGGVHFKAKNAIDIMTAFDNRKKYRHGYVTLTRAD